ncbi:glycosyltransferase family 4 protein [Spirosoma utsteinense]|uniref:Colanic acid biosynthesis glycosyl transferase WcaI n=1 Tax=Spirosoma utsteinense TaxID=2585773 RepID=A0ABR6WG43_9BACT|nr:glycosyltransferase family 4 protein [Spirosoma utsteinense]MBC3787152.1 colanic acid biosynthesis glycosyl transferase WcaI [Spirosoma utsteinense]MBC3795041.1 colanic acid biosynthesis glycosyl transferase WcaI [Spirosoma utsteinense]
MKILVSSMTFAPDHSGISLYSTDFATYASEQGHDVTVVTGFSWYPKWEKRPEDKGKLLKTDYFKSIKVLRGYLYVPKKVTSLTRVIQEITFIIFAFINFFRAGKHDVIVVFTTPINLGLIGVLFQKFWKAKLIINVQDLQLDAAQSLGMLGKLPIIDVMNAVESYSYREADLVTSISDGMINLIRQKGTLDDDKIYLWPNWIDVNEANQKGTGGIFRDKFPQYKNKIIVGYAGNVGVKQSLSSLIDLSEKFKNYTDLVFLIIGQGGDLINLKAYAATKKTNNIDFIDFLSQEDYYNFLSDVDVVFLSQKNDSGDAYFPSKLLGIMAKKKLIFVAAGKDSEIYKVVANNKLGISAGIDELEYMEILVNNYLQNRDQFKFYESNAFDFVNQFDRSLVLRRLFNRINDSILFASSISKNVVEN